VTAEANKEEEPSQQHSVSQNEVTAEDNKEEEKKEEYQDLEALETQLPPQNVSQLNLNAPVFVPSFAKESGFVFDPSISLQQNPDFINLVALVN
jgi:hypothetical protein